MLRWAIIFFLLSLVSGFLGFTHLAAGFAAIARILFFIVVTLFVIFLIAAFTIEQKLSGPQ